MFMHEMHHKFPLFFDSLTFESFGLASIQTATAGFDANCLSPDPTATSSEDFLLVPNAVTQENIRVIRLCGNSVHTEVIVGECVVDRLALLVVHDI